MMTYYKWCLSLILLIVGVGLTSVQAQFYNTLDGAEVVPVGKIEIAPVNNSVYTTSGGSVKTISRAYGARFGLGLFKNFDVKLQFDFLDLPNKNGKAMYLIPKYAVGNTGFAVSFPLMAIDSESSNENFGFSPTILYSGLKLFKKKVEVGVNASRTEFVNSSHGWYTFGLAPSYKHKGYSIRAEYGVSLTDDPAPTAFHYGVAVTYLIP